MGSQKLSLKKLNISSHMKAVLLNFFCLWLAATQTKGWAPSSGHHHQQNDLGTCTGYWPPKCEVSTNNCIYPATPYARLGYAGCVCTCRSRGSDHGYDYVIGAMY